MFTIICIMILAYCIMGKNINSLLAKVKDADWKGVMTNLYEKIKPYALKVGRVTVRPLLQFYFVMRDENTSTLDRVLIYAAIIYTISPVSFLPAAVYRFLGVLDEGAAMLYVYNKIKDKITPEINMQVDTLLDEWFGVEWEMVE